MNPETQRRDAPARVAVVDDDDVNRRGIANLLSDHPCIELVVSLDHAQALARPDLLDDIDVLLVDAADERVGGDHFIGVTVVEQVRRRRPRPQTAIVVVTGHFFDDAVRRRMREARADFFYHRSELGDVQTLYDVVLRPGAHRDVPEPDHLEAMFSLGVTEHTRVNRAVEHARRLGLDADDGRTRRAWQAARREFNRHARLHPVTLDGRPPDRRQDAPSRSQIARFLLWAARVKTPPLPD